MGNQSTAFRDRFAAENGIGNRNSVRGKAMREWQTFDKLKADVKRANSYACCMKSNTLSFRLLVKRGIAKELIPVVWRFADNTKVQVTVNGGRVRPARVAGVLDNSITIQGGEGAIKTVLSSNSDRNNNNNNNRAVTQGGTVDLGRNARPCEIIVPISTFYKIFVLLLEVVDIPFGLDKKQSSKGNEEAEATEEKTAKAKSQKDEVEDYDKECIICMENDIEIVLQCSHAFCKDCYRKWKERNDACPYCRSTNMPDINSEDIWTIEETDCLEELNKRLVDLETMIMGLLLGR